MCELQSVRERALCLVLTLLLCGGCSLEPAKLPAGLVAPATEDPVLQASQPSDTEIVLTRTFAAAPERVFAALTEPELLKRWLGTREHALVECRLELQAGGKLRYVFQRPSGRRIEVRGEIQSVAAPHRFSYLESYDFSPLQVHVTTALRTAPEGTLLQQTLVYATREERDADFPGVFSSSQEAHARLAELLRS